MRVFAFIFTMAVSCENKPLWGIKYLSSKTHLCQRSIKQALKCLVNIGLLRKGDVLEDGSQTYTLAIKDCGTHMTDIGKMALGKSYSFSE